MAVSYAQNFHFLFDVLCIVKFIRAKFLHEKEINKKDLFYKFNVHKASISNFIERTAVRRKFDVEIGFFLKHITLVLYPSIYTLTFLYICILYSAWHQKPTEFRKQGNSRILMSKICNLTHLVLKLSNSNWEFNHKTN